MSVRISDIDIASYQIRDGLNEAAVERYCETLQSVEAIAWPFPPVVLNQTPEGYVCVDGAHRIAAAMKAGREMVEAKVVTLSDADAKVEAARANMANGLPLTPSERKKAIARLIELRPVWTDAAIAKVMGIHRNTVARVRKELGVGNRTARTIEAVEAAKAANPYATQEELAEAAGVSRGTISTLPRRFAENAPHGANSAKARPGVASPDFEGDRAADGCTNCDPEAVKPKAFTMVVAGTTYEASDIHDEIGQDIPVGRFAEYIEERLHIDEAVKTLRTLKHAIQARAEKDDFRAYSGPARKADDIVANLDIVINSIRERKPEVLCRCNGEGCRACQGRGFLTKKQYQTIIPEEERFAAGTL